MFCVFFLSRSLIDFSHPSNEKQRKNTLWPYERGSVSTVVVTSSWSEY